MQRTRYGAGFNLAAFNAFLKKNGLLKYAGGDDPRNVFTAPPVTAIDLRIVQEIPGFFPKARRPRSTWISKISVTC